ncbi:MAG: tetratricopeptide repeat protein [Pirellulales bacterium]|nr:tetratricopeptide repeat protein [Pirellulales bacterium]
MKRAHRIQIQRDLREAEGYLELQMPTKALSALDRIEDPGTFRGLSLYLRGEALRDLERYAEAIPYLTDATDISPSNVGAWLALAWCQKRTDRLAQAIDSLNQALDVEPSNPLLHYNLACYYSLAREKQLALASLARSLELDRNYLDLIPDEEDFEPLRNDPQFQDLTSIIV